MKKNLILVCFLAVLSAQPLFSQSWQMLRKIGIGNANDQAEVLYSATDSQGNTFVVGWYMGKITFGTVTFNGQLDSFTQYFLAKYDVQGNVQWARSIAGSRSEISVYDIQVDNLGNAYLIGGMSNTSDFFNGAVILGGGATLTLSSSWDPYNSSHFLAKYSASGEVVLKKFMTGNSLAVSKDGVMTLRGKLIDNYTLDHGQDDLSNFDSLTCYNSTGKKLWQKKTVLASIDMKLYADNGSLWMITDEDSQTIQLNGDTYVVSNETLITEYNPVTGDLLSVVPMDHRLLYMYPSAMELKNDHLYFYGTFRTTNHPSVTLGDFTVTTTKPEDTFYGYEGYLAKYDIRASEFEWAKHLTSVAEEGTMAIGNSGSIYINLGRNGINTPEIVGKFNAAGDPVWSLNSTAFIHDYAGLGLTQAEDIMVAGWVSNGGTAQFGSLNFTYSNQVGFLAQILNSSSSLSALSISSGTLSPAFTPGVVQYATLVDQTISSVTLTPVANDASAVIKVNGNQVTSGTASQSINLVQGNNVVTIDLTTADGNIRTYTVNVVRGNSAPVLSVIGNRSGSEGTSIAFTAAANDLQSNQVLSYSVMNAPVGASINSASGAFSWTPSETQGGNSFTFTVVVTDNGAPTMTDEEQITITVAEVNQAPVLTAIANSVIACGSNSSFVLSATDVDVPVQQLSFSLQGTVPSGATLNATTGQFSWTPTSTQLGAKTFTVRVTDSGSPGLYHEQTFTLTVNSLGSPVLGTIWSDNLVFNTTGDFSVNELPGATAYSWEVPTGFSLESGQNTRDVVIKALTGTGNGLITVTATGLCGEHNSVSRAITASKAEAVVTISDVAHEFSGEPHGVSVTTNPENLSVEVLYEGFTEAPSAEGEYNVIVSVIDDNYTGFGTAILSIFVVTAIDEEEANIISVVPNPTHGAATINFGITPVEFMVTDLSSRIILQGTASGSHTLNLSSYANGMYLVKCKLVGGKILVRKLIKN